MIQIGVTYNKNLIAREKTPETWEDYLKPEFKGKKIMLDIRPTEIAALVPAWGLEKTLDFARKTCRSRAGLGTGWLQGGGCIACRRVSHGDRAKTTEACAGRSSKIERELLPIKCSSRFRFGQVNLSLLPLRVAVLTLRCCGWNFKPALKGRKSWINLSHLAAPSMPLAQFKARK